MPAPSKTTLLTLTTLSRHLGDLRAQPEDPELVNTLITMCAPLADAVAQLLGAPVPKSDRTSSGRPKALYLINHESKGTRAVLGLREACELVNKPEGSVAVSLTRSGSYSFTDSGGDGEWCVTLTRADDEQRAQFDSLTPELQSELSAPLITIRAKPFASRKLA